MKKPFKFNQLAKDVTGTMRTHCACGCGRPLKANLVTRKDNTKPLLAFPCFRAAEADKGHDMSTAREVRTGVRPARSHVVFTKEEWRRRNG